MHRLPPMSTLFPYTTLFRSHGMLATGVANYLHVRTDAALFSEDENIVRWIRRSPVIQRTMFSSSLDRKSTRLNSSHPSISYAVFCLKKKKYYIMSIFPFYVH